MTLPGFRADAALVPTTERFRGDPLPVDRAGVIPQGLGFCHPCRGTTRVCCSIDVQGFVTCHTVPCLPT